MMTLIEVEGNNVNAVNVSALPLHVGQRYSVIINADQTVDNYYIRATIPQQCVHSNNSTINYNSSINYNVTGILRYDGASESDTPTSQPYDNEFTRSLSCLELNSSYLVPLKSNKPPTNVTDSFTFNLTVRADGENITRAFINNSSFVLNASLPSLNKIISGYAADTFPSHQNVHIYNTSDGVVQITILSKLSFQLELFIFQKRQRKFI